MAIHFHRVIASSEREEIAMETGLLLLILLGLPLFYVGVTGRELTDLGIKSKGLLRESVSGMLTGILLGVISLLSAWLLEVVGASDLEPVAEFIKEQGPGRIAALSVPLAIAEEIFFRGFLQGILFKSISRAFVRPMSRWAVTIVPPATLFGLCHLGYGSVVQIVATFILGLILGAIYQKRENIACPVMIHLFFNWVNIGYFFISVAHH